MAYTAAPEEWPHVAAMYGARDRSFPCSPSMTEVLRLTPALIALFTCTAAGAWGSDGHRLVAELAEAQLTPAARAEAARLLATEPGSTLVTISTWADETRSPHTAAWHYINPPSDTCTYEHSRDCPDGQCAVEALSREAAVLKSTLPDEARLKALKWVVHLVADLHQPLHAGFKADKGGNLYQVQAFGRGTNLHALWDSGLIRNRPGGIDALRQAAAMTGSAPAEAPAGPLWAMESCKVVLSAGFYPDGRAVGEAYATQWDPVLVERIQSAARRLAATLNDALR